MICRIQLCTFVQWGECDVVIEELAPLHDKEGVVIAGVVDVCYDGGAD